MKMILITTFSLALVGLSLAPDPEPSASLAEVLVACHTTEAVGLPTGRWIKLAQASAKRFDTLLESYASKAGASTELLGGDLAQIGRDRLEHPDRYEAIAKFYMTTNATPGARVAHPPAARPEHLSPNYRYVWEYYFMRPPTGVEVTGFNRLCSMSFIHIVGRQAANQFFRDFALTVASTPRAGVGIDRLLQWEIEQFMAFPNEASMVALLDIGAEWNQHHRGMGMNFGRTYEGELGTNMYFAAKPLSAGKLHLAGQPWPQLLGQAVARGLPTAQAAVAATIRSEMFKAEAADAALHRSTPP